VAERTLPLLPGHFFRWLFVPAFLNAIFALFAAAAAHIRRRTLQPALPRMSEQWLRTHDADSGHRGEFWRDTY
jgi:hypothetical protein